MNYRKLGVARSVSPAAAFYRASGFVLWREADIGQGSDVRIAVGGLCPDDRVSKMIQHAACSTSLLTTRRRRPFPCYLAGERRSETRRRLRSAHALRLALVGDLLESARGSDRRHLPPRPRNRSASPSAVSCHVHRLREGHAAPVACWPGQSRRPALSYGMNIHHPRPETHERRIRCRPSILPIGETALPVGLPDFEHRIGDSFATRTKGFNVRYLSSGN